MSKIVEAIVSPDGKTVQLSTSGFKGKACMEMDAAFNGLSKMIQTKTTAEYNAKEKPTDVNIVGRS